MVEYGVTILGPTNLPGQIPKDASQMFAKNVCTFLANMAKDGKLDINLDDEIVAGTLMTHEGNVTHPRIREMLGMEPMAEPSSQEETIPFDDAEDGSDDSQADGGDSRASENSDTQSNQDQS